MLLESTPVRPGFVKPCELPFKHQHPTVIRKRALFQQWGGSQPTQMGSESASALSWERKWLHVCLCATCMCLSLKEHIFVRFIKCCKMLNTCFSTFLLIFIDSKKPLKDCGEITYCRESRANICMYSGAITLTRKCQFSSTRHLVNMTCQIP